MGNAWRRVSGLLGWGGSSCIIGCVSGKSTIGAAEDATTDCPPTEAKPEPCRAGKATIQSGTANRAIQDLPSAKHCASVQSMKDRLAAPVLEFISLYEERYANVQFPGLDLPILEGAANAVVAAAAKLADAQAAVDPLREQLKVAEGELTQKVLRALAFLKVYVDGDEDQFAQLDALTQALVLRHGSRKASDTPMGSRGGRGRKPRATESAQPDASDIACTAGELCSALSEFERVAE